MLNIIIYGSLFWLLFFYLIKDSWKERKYLLGEMGGGGETSVQQAPTTPAPSASESAKDLYEARLNYDPKTAAMEYNLAQQYSPLYGALYKQTVESQFPGMGNLTNQGITGASGELMSAYGLAPESAATIATRDRLRKQMRESRNIGGGLYGGRGLAAEDRSVEELQQAFRTEAQQRAIPYLQILYPQISQTPAVSRGTTASPDTLYNAMFQASQPQQIASQSPDRGGQAMGMAGGIAGAAILAI